MASIVLEKLRSIESGRKLAIHNAKLANLPAADNMDITDLAGLFLQQNNTSYINPNDPSVVGTGGEHGGWTRPSDWCDIDTALSEAEDRDGLHPAYILLLADWDVSTDFAATTSTKNLRGDGFLTSDGAWYLASSGNCVHTWDTTKDVPCSEGYKTRWVMVYTASATISSQIIIGKDMPCLEALFGAITIGSDKLIFGSSTGSSYANTMIQSIRYTAQTVQSTISAGYFAASCVKLKNVSMPALKTINGGNTFSYCPSLTSVSMPALTTISGNGYTFSYCSSLTSVSMPALKTINGGNTFSYCPSLTSVSIPALTTISSESTFSGCSSLTSVSMPALTSITGSNTFNSCSSLTSVSMPALTTISGASTFTSCSSLKTVSMSALTTISGGSTFSGCSSLTEYAFLSTMSSLSNLNNMFSTCYGLISVELPSDWDFPSLSVSAGRLSVPSMLAMIDALKDRTGDTAYTLTLGSTNLSKLTAAQIAVATNKNWTLA